MSNTSHTMHNPSEDLSSANSSTVRGSSVSKRRQLYAHHHEEEKKSDVSETADFQQQQDDDQEYSEPLIRRPQHHLTSVNHEDEDATHSNIRYYRVVYRGVVALLSEPDASSSRSGSYLSYGEIVKSKYQIINDNKSNNLHTLNDDDDDDDDDDDVIAIRVDEILTGGYAFDPPDVSAAKTAGGVQNNTETPKRSNVQGYSTIGATTAVPAATGGGPPTPSVTLSISHSSSATDDPLDLEHLKSEAQRCYQQYGDGTATTTTENSSHHGFLFCQNKRQEPILEALSHPPKCEHGRFFYKVVSTTPLPIVTGPSLDAPPTKAMVLPGSIHEISFRMQISESNGKSVWFLRLGRRKGYIADRRLGPSRPSGDTNNLSESLVKDITELYQRENATEASDLNTNYSTLSEGTHSVNAPSTIFSQSSTSAYTARNKRSRRHRPPRRKKDEISHGRPQHSAARSRMHDSAHDDSHFANLSVQSHSSDRLVTPSSNVSVLSDDSSMMGHHHYHNHSSFCSHENAPKFNGALSPDRSVARSVKSNTSSAYNQQPKQQIFFLMRVTAPRGLRILDAPHFQVNNLIHGTQQQSNSSTSTTQDSLMSSSSMDISALSGLNSTKHQHHLFHTMAGRITAGMNPADNAVIFDSVTKTRILPRGAVFEASRRMETSEALFHQGAGLIKLADNSGWVIVPHPEEIEHQYRSGGGVHGTVAREGENSRGYEEVGNAIVYEENCNDTSSSCDGRHDGRHTSDYWMRVVARAGVHVVCAPPVPPTLNGNSSGDTSPSSSTASPSTKPASQTGDSNAIGKCDSSEVASSVGSSFLDAMFRTQKRKDPMEGRRDQKAIGPVTEKPLLQSNVIPCGMCVPVEPQIPVEPSRHQRQRDTPQEYARIRGGGWIPLSVAGKPTCGLCPRYKPPVSRFGSFWYRVQSSRGMKVRLGPSKRAPSIKSGDGVYFRFECGEFLRASEVLTVYQEDKSGRTWSESFAKLYRNRHVRAAGNDENSGVRTLLSMTAQAEWVQIHDGDRNEFYLEECAKEPRIERHRQGWRYSVVGRTGAWIKKGPSSASENTGVHIEEGDHLVAIERVVSAEENGATWLRVKEGGWVQDTDQETGETLLVPNTLLRHRTRAANSRPEKPRRRPTDEKEQQMAYNTLIARLFHTDGHGPNSSNTSRPVM